MKRGWMPWALAVSVAINLAVLGAIGGAWLVGDRTDLRRDRAAGVPTLLRGLTREERRALRSSIGPREQRTAGAQLDLPAMLRQEPFDEVAFREALDARRAIQGARAARGIEALATLIAELSPERRAALADHLERGRRFPRSQ
ncbi:periplasmic heavy metal sensor [Jannaschia aquimarina]|uniref:Periplasmic heavy metal sensor n=1 Tax=Jannaschia aquimarina TaxID=935700 RepID=A0A0D1DAG7_9RHOB|nr:periplasmic heavy metal sensor [Jannaschia aquimarina]KIT16918.1 hypothetical protein jaqu_14170 [Jannaschia aquimarina]SNT11638.1 Heavy-metal resistance [Jannaschia aquimarina]